ncbi:nuclear transport factor 2 family protein [Bradyrhizobium sp. dw_78]|uniref:YybH family protein n=1 Tax=Bradyrhizobium sp. dw_78 TaxID=2719793 RepID=UPI001BD50A62|nr:nuclear transport factor 2 family protein [Bradyrhizobium sp. dw_78]
MPKAYKITDPSQTNATFAKIFNEGRNVDAWVSLYEPDAVLFDGPNPVIGHEAIRKSLAGLTNVPGAIETKVNFVGVNGDIALVRADYRFRHEGKITLTGSAIEVARRQPDGNWLFIIDHATGASVPSAWEAESGKA